MPSLGAVNTGDFVASTSRRHARWQCISVVHTIAGKRRLVLGVSVALGTRVQEITGMLAQSPRSLASLLATLAADEQVDVDLSAVEVREFYEHASTGAQTTAPSGSRGAPSGSRSGST